MNPTDLELLRIRLAETEALANDSLDLALGTPLPDIPLTPPATPQQEVFGSGAPCWIPGALTLIEEDGALYLVQPWILIGTGAPTAAPEGGIPENDTRPRAPASLGADNHYAVKLPLTAHADDHTAGVLPLGN